jgi:hypothetical protein
MVLLYDSPIPGCDGIFRPELDPRCPRIPRNVKRKSSSQVAKLEYQLRTFKERQKEYECLRDIHEFEAKHDETVPPFSMRPPDPPPFGLPGAEAMLKYHKSKNTFNPVDPESVLPLVEYHPIKRTTHFRVKSVRPRNLTIPLLSATMKIRHQRTQERITAMIVRIDAAEKKAKREKLHDSWSQQQLKFEKSKSRLEYPSVMELKKRMDQKNQEKEEEGEDIRQLLEDLDEFDRKSKIGKERPQETLWSGEGSVPFLPADCEV